MVGLGPKKPPPRRGSFSRFSVTQHYSDLGQCRAIFLWSLGLAYYTENNGQPVLGHFGQ
ncbi:hypothetical protein MGG_09288 [Pyricularia oryzae 70-15]|uniref:Uncharacterized protein n=3 Tax=Pyricularia oryzae TaxID=318829 RepID=G4MQN8_PYRO7|nr:uncharacterized protein MGG_09288 [Pyricularia oryzae 70-15]EHA57325.1 hypothetical protein MGG_09288 [Pyricularia oryzae 70-15]ELQ40596.1 hypothetical protein OOU_Y34scaffold00414g27 [Pyricularia oryzae Y34]